MIEDIPIICAAVVMICSVLCVTFLNYKGKL